MYNRDLRRTLIAGLLAVFGLCHLTRAADLPTAAPPTAAPPTAAPTPPATVSAPAAAASQARPADALPPIAPPLSTAQVVQFLDQSIDWYRTLGVQQQVATEPSDLLFLYDDRQTAARVIAIAFDIARADADILGKEGTTQTSSTDPQVSSQALMQLQKKLEAQSESIESELDAQRRDIPPASGKTKAEVQAKINELKGELDLVNTKKGIVNTMAGFASGSDGSSAGALKAQIDAMAVAIPAANNSPASVTAASPAAAASPASGASSLLGAATASATVARFGLWDLAADASRLSEKMSKLTSIDRSTAALQATLAQIRAPLIDQMKTLSSRGDALAAQADSADSATLNGLHDQLDALTGQFKVASSLLIPLSREGILLGQYRRNLSNWRAAVQAQFHESLKALGIRLAVVLVVLGVLFGAAELWRRTVLRYIQDTRRRYQLLLLRRIALWSLVVIVIGIAFASELGSIVTFAGLITAGIAVAMQSVLVSIVGYFFLIGKYGIRVGDRVQIGEVAGEVIDLGLVRMYLMELGAKGTTGPTGRVVAFANSVVFQVSSGLFKQIPGVNFSWREVTLTLPAGINTASAKEKLLAAATEALKDYREEIQRQTREIERTTLSSTAAYAEPQVQLHFSATGVEAHVRYPVHMQHAAEIDERVTEALANVISSMTAAPGGGDPAHAG